MTDPITLPEFVIARAGKRWTLTADHRLVVTFARKRDAQRLVTFVQSGGARLDLLAEHHAVALAEIHPSASNRQKRELLTAPSWVARFLSREATLASAQRWRELTDLALGPVLTEAEERARVRAEIDAEERARVDAERRHADTLAAAERARAARAVEVAESVRLPQARAAIASIVARGEVLVVNAGSEVYDTGIAWGDWTERVTWQVWARPAAERLGTAAAWDRCTTEQALVNVHVEPITQILWSACADQYLPDVLDLRGAPEAMHGDLRSRWVEALREALGRSKRGSVIIVRDGAPAWSLARMLS